MSFNELMQWAMVGALAVFVVLVIAALVTWSLRQSAIWPQCAKKLGLTYEKKSSGSVFLTGTSEERSLEGVACGVPVRVVYSRQTTGRITRRGTRVFGRAHAPTPHRFTVQVQRGVAVGADYHVVPTGDQSFDSFIVVKSDAPGLARGLIDVSVRAALRQLPFAELQLSYHAGELTLSFAAGPSSLRELEGAIQVVIAAARVALVVQDVPRQDVAPTLENHLERLGWAHGFTLEQLAANRAGQIHPTQLRRGRRKELGCAAAFFLLALLAFTGFEVGAFLLYDDLRPPIDRVDLNAVIALAASGLLSGLLLTVIAIATFVSVARRRRAYAGGRPYVVEGPVSKNQIVSSRGGDAFMCFIGSQRFPVSQAAYDLMTQGARYRAYCMGDDLLSIEPI